MTDLLCLPALTTLDPQYITHEAYSLLPRFSRLQRLRVPDDFESRCIRHQRQAQQTALLSALAACPTLPDLTLAGGDCTEPFGEQLMQAVPRLRSLHFGGCSLPSLRFLRQAQNLKELSLTSCRNVRSDHLFCLSSFAPQLECLSVEYCDGLLDQAQLTRSRALVFGFVEMKELARAARTCKVWMAVTAKEKPRGLSLIFERVDQLVAVCAVSSPFQRHISSVNYRDFSLSLDHLVQLRQLPELTVLQAQLSMPDLTRLMAERGDGALAALQAAFPPKLQKLALWLPEAHSPGECQLLLDALPAMKGLKELNILQASTPEPGYPASLSLKSLQQPPRLTHLGWKFMGLTVSQLRAINQIATLQSFEFTHCGRGWTAVQLAAFCTPPRRLQQLKKLNLQSTSLDEAAMASLLCLPALTALEPRGFTPGAYAFLPRLPRLRRLRLPNGFNSGGDAAQREAHTAALVSALPACPALTDLTLKVQDFPESFGDQLKKAVPRLRTLHLDGCSLPSLRFLRHAPNLVELFMTSCRDVRPGHVLCLSSFAPQLERLPTGVQLDLDELRLLVQPPATGLRHLRQFNNFIIV